ncbi:hypothetical protein THRCLA_06576 [Thraustotheca clavata]|uniref:WW domain-containing protein n=1 Tax=Thraustotheca clavata TaxID=74557 RepID=A0A1V9ZMG9_9STRA|nr:hypothetical protein THRCLA_06576 [Thraustotheca clavata]
MSGTSAWVRHLDADSNMSYYYNKETGETSWKKPVGLDEESGGEKASKEAKNEPQVDDDGCMWIKYIDPTTNKPYYSDMNSGKTQWEAPAFYTSDQGEDDDEEVDENMDEEYTFGAVTNQSSTQENDETRATKATQEDEQPDYYRYYDESSQKHYYFNVQTKETTWTEPTGAVIKDGTGAETQAVTGSAKYQEWMDKASSAAAASTAGNTIATHAQPAASAAAKNDPVNRLNSILGNVGSSNGKMRWQQHYDTNTERYYYYDTQTNTTQWEIPTEGGIASGAADWVPVDTKSTAKNSAAAKVGHDYTSTAQVGLVSGRFAGASMGTDYWTKQGIPTDKAGRQMSNFFDLSTFEANRAEAKRIKEALQKKNIDWKKFNEEKKRKRHRIRNKWMYED